MAANWERNASESSGAVDVEMTVLQELRAILVGHAGN